MITIYFNVDSCTLIQEEPFRKRLLKELVLLYIKKKILMPVDCIRHLLYLHQMHLELSIGWLLKMINLTLILVLRIK